MRIGVFHNAIGGSEEILGELSQQIQNIGESFELSPQEREARLQQLADNEIRQVQEEEALEDKQSQLFGLNVPQKGWEKDLEEAENFWLSPRAIQQCVKNYLADRTTSDTGYHLGDKPLKTLRLSQEARVKLLTDMQGLRKTNDPAARQWEKWLKGANPNLPITFDQEVAADNPEAAFLTVMHPLVRQAARNLERNQTLQANIVVSTEKIPEGRHPFAIYRWKKLGVKMDEVLVPIAHDVSVETSLMGLIQEASNTSESSLFPESLVDELDSHHHLKWRDSQTQHITENHSLIEQRVQSLTISHQARCGLLSDQIEAATNDRIRLMKQSELARANVDFSRRKDELDQAARSADVHSTLVVVGFITNSKEVES